MDKENIIKLKDKYYISADSTYADNRTKVLNYKDTFGIFDRWGDIKQIGKEIQGIYNDGTRYISNFDFMINNTRPLLLSSEIKEENEILSVDLTNSEIKDSNGVLISRGSIHIHRSKFIRDKVFEKITFTNYNQHLCEIECEFLVDADYKDIFEVRGIKRMYSGKKLGFFSLHDRAIVISYKGKDNITRNTILSFSGMPIIDVENGMIKYRIALNSKSHFAIEYSIAFEHEDSKNRKPLNFAIAKEKIDSQLAENKKLFSSIQTSNEQFNHWINRSEKDLLSLLADTKTGKYPYAGVPWYNTAFGRDGIITAIEALLVAPELSKDVLFYLSEAQANEIDEKNDAEPGKILHETRGGEMANTREVPFHKYYGTIDATPLFVILAGKYYKRTGDLDSIKHLWPHIKKALHWIDNYGDIDQDGFVEYQLKSENGLVNQGWKDSYDSISHANGQLAQAPIALCEVQGYVYQAKLLAAEMAEALQEIDLAKQLKKQASILQEQFHDYFWSEELNNFILALDGNKKPCLVDSSNVGHCLFSGIIKPEYAEFVIKKLMSPEMFTGWGIRTLSSSAVRYNPMSYHNGSVWPHDTAMIAYGMAKYGYNNEVLKVVKGLFDASLFLELQRLPELFCGFTRRKGEGTTAY
ncbi:MAG: glycogen debranching N-terminal domain-containing protein, partial [Cyclobacteriaceae bacterium]